MGSPFLGLTQLDVACFRPAVGFQFFEIHLLTRKSYPWRLRLILSTTGHKQLEGLSQPCSTHAIQTHMTRIISASDHRSVGFRHASDGDFGTQRSKTLKILRQTALKSTHPTPPQTKRGCSKATQEILELSYHDKAKSELQTLQRMHFIGRSRLCQSHRAKTGLATSAQSIPST